MSSCGQDELCHKPLTPEQQEYAGSAVREKGVALHFKDVLVVWIPELCVNPEQAWVLSVWKSW